MEGMEWMEWKEWMDNGWKDGSNGRNGTKVLKEQQLHESGINIIQSGSKLNEIDFNKQRPSCVWRMYVPTI